MKKQIITLLILMCSIPVWSARLVDGIYYSFFENNGVFTAQVESNSSKYTGDIIIPSTVVFEGNTYTVITIVNDAFKNCVGLTSISIPESVSYIGEQAFFNCDALTTITIPQNVSGIGRQAFSGCEKLRTVIYNAIDYTTIGENVFYDTDITTLIVGTQVTRIPHLFGDKRSLTSVTLLSPSKVTNIESETFINCYALASLTIAEGVKSIGDNVFSRCYALTQVNLPNSITNIGEFAFEQCDALTQISLPNSANIGGWAFRYCWKLAQVNFFNNETSIENTSIGNGAFRDCRVLTQINLPDNVTNIEEWAFAGCTSAQISLPNNLTSIGSYAFADCLALTQINIPIGVTNIKEGTFANCDALALVTIPENITIIGNHAFSSCVNLTEIRSLMQNPPVINANVFTGVTKSACTLSVPKNTTRNYQNSPVWKDFFIIARESLLEDYLNITPEINIATITWQRIENATGYKLVIYGDESRTTTICTIEFDVDGEIINVRPGARVANITNDFSYTIDNLLSNSTYYYDLSAINTSGIVIDKAQGNFKTLATSSVNDVSNNRVIVYAKDNQIIVKNTENQPVKIVDINGRILANNKNASSIEKFRVPNKGVYLVVVNDVTRKVLVY